MLASWISAVVAPRSVVRAEAASDRAPLSPLVPIWAKIKMMIGRTRKRSFVADAPAGPALTAGLCMVSLLFDIC